MPKRVELISEERKRGEAGVHAHAKRSGGCSMPVSDNYGFRPRCNGAAN